MEGRFISKDSIGYKGGDVNLYGYVHNNPVNFSDPNGMARYHATLSSKGIGYIGGVLYLSGEVKSFCVDHEQEKGFVRVFLIGASTKGFGWTDSSMVLQDGAPGRGSVNNLSGFARIIYAGFAFGPVGGSFTNLILGAASTRGTGIQTGFDIGSLAVMPGWSTVCNVHKECCDTIDDINDW